MSQNKTVQKTMRLDRMLSSLGYATRSGVAHLIKHGDVTIAGERAKSPSQHAHSWEVKFRGEELDPGTGMVVLFHKPSGYVCAHSGEESMIYDLLPERWRLRRPVVASVGRLDADTSGVLLLTDNGALLHRLTSPKHKVPKVYEVKLEQPLRGDEQELFASGTLMLAEEHKPLLPAELQIVSPTEARLTLYEGRYHQVKRMFEHVGNRVVELHRSLFGNLGVGELKPGEYRFLSGEEVSLLILAEAGQKSVSAN